MNVFNVAGVDVPIVDGPKGICVSGGADSSILLYILLKNSIDPLYIFTLAKDLNGRATAITSANVIEKCIQLSNNSNVIHHVYYKPTQDNSQLFSVPTEFYNKDIIKGFYTGLTKNPPKDIGDSFCGADLNTEHNSRNPLIVKDTEHTTICGLNAKVFTPFINIDKRRIADMYKELWLMDNLYPLTRSCEVVDRLQYYDHCGICWWCKERIWGFGKL